MERLFEALSQLLLQPLTGILLSNVSAFHENNSPRCASQLDRLVQDIVARDWGDGELV
jgi:hypothetical protein